MVLCPAPTAHSHSSHWRRQAGKTYYNCEVKSVLDFGVFVELLPGKDGLVGIPACES